MTVTMVLRNFSILLFFGPFIQLIKAREKPELTFGVNVDKIGVGTRFRESLGILEPTVKWTHGGRVIGCDYAVSTIFVGLHLTKRAASE
jgi:hypothetical protein